MTIQQNKNINLFMLFVPPVEHSLRLISLEPDKHLFLLIIYMEMIKIQYVLIYSVKNTI